MKKFLLVLSSATFIFIGTAKGQLINTGFENWMHTAMGPFNPVAYDDLVLGAGQNGWLTLNVTSSNLLGASPVSVFKDSVSPSPHGGKYCALIKTVQLSHTTIGQLGGNIPDTVIGIVSTGQVTATPKLIFGYPFGTRITQVTFYYQYQPSGTDTGFAYVALTHKTHVLGAGVYYVNSTVSSWTMGTVNIFYDSASGSPDTIHVTFSSSSYHTKTGGSQFWIDDVASNPASVSDLFANSLNVQVYPNPASTQVNFHVPFANGEEGYAISVYDVTGKKLNTYPVKNDFASVNTSNFSSGLYFYQLHDKTGTQVKMGKFSVVK